MYLAAQGALPPTIMVTGHGDEAMAVEAMKLGAGDYLVKDVDGHYLTLLPTVVARVLHQQRLIEEKRQAEVALQETLATLEKRVRVRTADLQRANAQLRAEIIERRRAEEALTRLSRQHQLILEAAGEGIYGVDWQGKVTFINPAAAQMLGWEVEALIGQVMHDRIHHRCADGTPLPWEACPVHGHNRGGKAPADVLCQCRHILKVAHRLVKCSGVAASSGHSVRCAGGSLSSLGWNVAIAKSGLSRRSYSPPGVSSCHRAVLAARRKAPRSHAARPPRRSGSRRP